MNTFLRQVAILIYCLRSEGHYFNLHALILKHALQLRWLLIPRRQLLMFAFRANGSLEMTNLSLSMFTEMLNNHRLSSLPVGPTGD